MKTRSIIAAAILSITGSAAFAHGEATYEYPQAIASAKSKAEVKAELQQARIAGLIVSGEANVQWPSRLANTSPVRALTAAAQLPLNVEAISFDGRAPQSRDTLVAQK